MYIDMLCSPEDFNGPRPLCPLFNPKNIMKIRPLNDVVFLTPLYLTKKQTIIAVNPTEDTGRIVAISEKLMKEHNIENGTIVRFDPDAAVKQTVDGHEFIMIRFKDLIATLN
jgi:co-chaperonin GroES (HSP10)